MFSWLTHFIILLFPRLDSFSSYSWLECRPFHYLFFPLPWGWRLSHVSRICLTTLCSMSQRYRSRFTMKQLRRRPLWVTANRWRSSEAAKLLLAAGDDLLTAVARQEYHSTNKRWELWLSWIVSPLGQAGWQLWPFTDICLDAYTCTKVCFNGTLSNHLHVSEIKTPRSSTLFLHLMLGTQPKRHVTCWYIHACRNHAFLEIYAIQGR